MANIIFTEELTSEAYLPFGNVIAASPVDRSTVPRADKSIVFANMGTALRFNRLLDYKNLRSHAKMNVCVFRSTPIKMPFDIKLLERHQFSTQVFIPMSVKEKYLVLFLLLR